MIERFTMRFRYSLGLLLLCCFVRNASAYVEAPMSFGAIVQQSVIICSMVVTKVDKQNNLIIYQKLQDFKGKHPQEVIKHNIGRGGLRPGEWQEIMNWAEVGKTAVFCHNGSASETYIGSTWYQAYPGGEWWAMSHGEPFLLRSYAGKPEKLGPAVLEMLAGKEVIVPCMVDGDKEALHKKTAKIQRLKASLKLQDYNPKRDFAGWGGEDIRTLSGMPGFNKFGALGRVDSEAQSATTIDFDSDGKPDICLAGPNKVMLLQNGGDAFTEVSLPNLSTGARSAVWADYTGDGLPDLFLATPLGPKLYTNLGKGQFRDDTRLLPREAAYNLTAAAWADVDGDGKPDLILANGFHGLRVYKNIRNEEAVKKFAPPKLGAWHAVGPFRHKDGPQNNFDFAFPPETEKTNKVDLAKGHKGKRDIDIKWEKKEYTDGSPNDLRAFGENCATYLYRTIDVNSAMELPASFGSDDMLTVWLNGEKLISENTQRGCAPDQNFAKLKLQPGTNHLLLKVCNTSQDYAFYFAAGDAAMGGDPWFTDVSEAWGFGPNGLASDLKGDTLTVADFNNDGKPDLLFGAAQGMLFLNSGKKFELKADSGINYKPGKVGPSLGNFNGDGLVDLFIPQASGCKLYRNDGTGKFTDVTAQSGELAKLTGYAVGAAWGDFDNDGKPDLLVCMLRGANRFFRNNGDGTFSDHSTQVGLSQRVFNTQAAAWADLNNDGKLDLILANEGQESAVLFGGMESSKLTPVVVRIPPGAVGSSLTITNAEGKAVAKSQLLGGDGRGGQAGLVPRFALAPGNYKLAIRSSDGKTVEKSFSVASNPMNVLLD
jgi:hypothetical protein